MINVRLTANRLDVTGHAKRPDGVPPGANIICAAVSALTLTLVEGLTSIAREDIEVQQCAGRIVVEWKELSTIGHALVDTWLIGMSCIRESYGEIEIVTAP